MSRDVILPNGKVIENVPDNVSKDEIKYKAIANGLATEEDFVVKTDSPQQQESVKNTFAKPSQDFNKSTSIVDRFLKGYDATTNFMIENAPAIGAGIGGVLGSGITPLAGSAVGAGIGGGIGEAVKQSYKNPDKPIVATDVAKEAAISGATDLGGGLVFKGASALFPSIKKIFMDAGERASSKFAEASAKKAEQYALSKGIDLKVSAGNPLTKGMEESSDEVVKAARLALDEFEKLPSKGNREAITSVLSEITNGGERILKDTYGQGLKQIQLDRYKVDVEKVKRNYADMLTSQKQKGVSSDKLFTTDETNSFITNFFKETQGGKVSADVFESRFVSQAKEIQRKAVNNGDSATAREMGQVIKGLEGAMDQSLLLQGAKDELLKLKTLRASYGGSIQKLNADVFKKIAENPPSFYGLVKDSKSAKELVTSLEEAQKLSPNTISKESVDNLKNEVAGLLLERKMNLGIYGREATANSLKLVERNLSKITKDREFMDTLKALGGTAKESDITSLAKYTEVMVGKLYKQPNRSIAGDTKQLITDASLSAVVGSKYALVRLLGTSLPWASSRTDLKNTANIRRWMNRVASGEITVDAAIKLGNQIVGREFGEYLQNRAKEEE